MPKPQSVRFSSAECCGSSLNSAHSEIALLPLRSISQLEFLLVVFVALAELLLDGRTCLALKQGSGSPTRAGHRYP